MSRLRPGAGFVFLLLVGMLAISFFAWGFRTPRLDRIWRMSIELRVGQRKPLRDADFRMFQQALCDHPKLADDFLDGEDLAIISANKSGLIENGQAYLIRAEGSSLRIAATVPGGAKKENRIEMQARTTEETAEGSAAPGDPFSWPASVRHECATLIEVRGKKGLFTVGAER